MCLGVGLTSLNAMPGLHRVLVEFAADFGEPGFEAVCGVDIGAQVVTMPAQGFPRLAALSFWQKATRLFAPVRQ